MSNERGREEEEDFRIHSLGWRVFEEVEEK
jgi:hypothetical protein